MIAAKASALVPLLAQNAARLDRDASFPIDNLAALRRSGLLGLLIPTTDGGLGGGLRDLVEVAGILASGCLSTAMVWVMHCQQVAAVLNYGSRELCAELLPQIGAGQVYLASVTSERGKGGDLLSGIQPLQAVDEGWKLFRDAPIVTGAMHADGYLVTMRAEANAPENALSLVYLDRSQIEVAEYGQWNPMGMRATESRAVTLTASVRPSQIVGEPGGFRKIAVSCFAPVGHLGWAACWIGAASEALRGVVALYGSPDAPGSFDVRSDLFTRKLGRIRVDLELAAAYLRSVLTEVVERRAPDERLDENASQIHLNSLKIASSEISFRVVDELIDLVGLSVGYQKNSPIPLERLFRDLRSASLNYHNDRLLTATGRLCLLDRAVRLE